MDDDTIAVVMASVILVAFFLLCMLRWLQDRKDSEQEERAIREERYQRLGKDFLRDVELEYPRLNWPKPSTVLPTQIANIEPDQSSNGRRFIIDDGGVWTGVNVMLILFAACLSVLGFAPIALVDFRNFRRKD